MANPWRFDQPLLMTTASCLQLGINVLSYGAAVEIDPGVRGDFSMLLLALQAADVVASLVVSLQANGQDVYVNR